ncbi:Ead domain protein [Klebsiella pneumoniae]|nr:Ead domain protein [Klebsiella pneumoniae]
MTDITELALRLKLEAHRAVSDFNPQVNIKTRDLKALVEALELEKRICATWRKTAESTSEKLKKAQAAERRWHRVVSRVHEQACESDVKIDELEAINAAAEKLVRCKGRYHSEQNYRALAALFGVNTPDLPPLDDKSRDVNVEKLQESAYRAGLTAGWNLGLANNNDGFNKCLAAHAAGIKVEDE